MLWAVGTENENENELAGGAVRATFCFCGDGFLDALGLARVAVLGPGLGLVLNCPGWKSGCVSGTYAVAAVMGVLGWDGSGGVKISGDGQVDGTGDVGILSSLMFAGVCVRAGSEVVVDVTDVADGAVVSEGAVVEVLLSHAGGAENCNEVAGRVSCASG